MNKSVDVPLESLAELVCSRLGTTLREVSSVSRAERLVQARAIMAILVRRGEVGSIAELARLIDRDPSSLSKLVRRSEGKRQVEELAEKLLAEIIHG